MTTTNTIPLTTYMDYAVKPVPNEYFYDKIADFVYIVKNIRPYMHEAVCLQCGTTFAPDMLHVQCPHCGNQAYPLDVRNGTANDKTFTVLKYENTNLPDNSLLVRIFLVKCKHPSVKVSFVYPKTGSDIFYSISETHRIFMGKKRVVLEGCNGHFETGFSRRLTGKEMDDFLFDLQCYFSARHGHMHCTNTDEELKAILDASFFKNTAAAAAIGLIPNKKKLFDKAQLEFFYGWYQNHAISQAYIDGLYNIVYDIGAYWTPRKDRLTGTTPRNMLGLTKQEYKIVQVCDPKLDDLKYLYDTMYQDPAFAVSEYCALANTITPKKIASLTKHKISCKDICAYLNSQNTLHQLTAEKASDMWEKYLAYSQQLGCNVADNEILFPNNVEEALLIAEHRMNKAQLA